MLNMRERIVRVMVSVLAECARARAHKTMNDLFFANTNTHTQSLEHDCVKYSRLKQSHCVHLWPLFNVLDRCCAFCQPNTHTHR